MDDKSKDGSGMSTKVFFENVFLAILAVVFYVGGAMLNSRIHETRRWVHFPIILIITIIIYGLLPAGMRIWKTEDKDRKFLKRVVTVFIIAFSAAVLDYFLLLLMLSGFGF